eukprot:TRINITY_DN121_c0_g1_i2.p2 TRINITY_DN121_c0_g1~~TRINITY_DN121_c0_g1_i2.p2  ORF type:complete len:449 (+),score=112.95 TRINITY_DN121_c0_g1_i2:89-1348(+)
MPVLVGRVVHYDEAEGMGLIEAGSKTYVMYNNMLASLGVSSMELDSQVVMEVDVDQSGGKRVLALWGGIVRSTEQPVRYRPCAGGYCCERARAVGTRLADCGGEPGYQMFFEPSAPSFDPDTCGGAGGGLPGRGGAGGSMFEPSAPSYVPETCGLGAGSRRYNPSAPSYVPKARGGVSDAAFDTGASGFFPDSGGVVRQWTPQPYVPKRQHADCFDPAHTHAASVVSTRKQADVYAPPDCIDPAHTRAASVMSTRKQADVYAPPRKQADCFEPPIKDADRDEPPRRRMDFREPLRQHVDWRAPPRQQPAASFAPAQRTADCPAQESLFDRVAQPQQQPTPYQRSPNVHERDHRAQAVSESAAHAQGSAARPGPEKVQPSAAAGKAEWQDRSRQELQDLCFRIRLLHDCANQGIDTTDDN